MTKNENPIQINKRDTHSKFKYLNIDFENDMVYFGYCGSENEFEVILSWREITVYSGRMKLSSNSDVIYYIKLLFTEKLFEKIDDFIIEFKSGDVVEKLPVIINEKKNNFEIFHKFKTIKEDVSYFTYKEILLDKIYVSDKVKVDKDDLVVDIGSNYGFFAHQSIEMGARKVICYEPSQRLHELLEYNLRNTNTTINQMGVSGKNGISKFRDDLISSASSSISEGDEGYEVRIIGINELIDSLNETIDFLKIDCEGQEVNIFKDIESNRLSKIKKIVVEFHKDETEILIKNKLLSENFVVEKIENNIIYAYNPKLIVEQKKVALISTFCDTEEKLSILEENIIKLKALNIDVIAISPILIPQKIVNLCDYFFYTKDNELLKWPIRMYTHWYEMKLPNGNITTLQRGLADYGWAGLSQVKKLSQIALTFDYDIFYHLIYDLEIDEVVKSELKSSTKNIIHPRRDPHNPENLWETTLHFMVFDRLMMEKIVDEIQLDEYLRTNGVAEGEVLKWKNKFNIPTSNHPVKDRIFYWENFDFFNYSPFSDFKMFISKNDKMTIWLSENPPYQSELNDNLKLVFHGFENMNEIKIILNGQEFQEKPKNWEILEIPFSSQKIEKIQFFYNNNLVDFTTEYKNIMLNQIYYNHRP